jgi:hypothetical protein
LAPDDQNIFAEEAPCVAAELADAAAAVADAEAREREETYQRLIPYARNQRDRDILQIHREGGSTSDIVDRNPGVSFRQIDNFFARLERRAA